MQDLDMERLKKGEPSKEEIKEPEQKKVKKRCKRNCSYGTSNKLLYPMVLEN